MTENSKANYVRNWKNQLITYFSKNKIPYSKAGLELWALKSIKKKEKLISLLGSDSLIIGKTKSLPVFEEDNALMNLAIKRIETFGLYSNKYSSITNLLEGVFLRLRQRSKNGVLTSNFNAEFPYSEMVKINPKFRIPTKGMKVSKVISKWLKDDEINLRVSNLIQESESLEIHLGLRPIDFLSMSDGNSWSSCHSIKKGNCYQTGGASLMQDEVSLVAWAGDWENKKWRQMFYVDLNSSKTIVGSRSYPFINQRATEMIEDYLKDLLFKETEPKIYYGREVIDLMDHNLYWDDDDESFYDAEDGEFFYHDIVYGFTDGVKGFSDLTFAEPVLEVGGAVQCPVCGEPLYSHDQLVCCANELMQETCDVCGRPSSETYVLDGERICEQCYDHRLTLNNLAEKEKELEEAEKVAREVSELNSYLNSQLTILTESLRTEGPTTSPEKTNNVAQASEIEKPEYWKLFKIKEMDFISIDMDVVGIAQFPEVKITYSQYQHLRRAIEKEMKNRDFFVEKVYIDSERGLVAIFRNLKENFRIFFVESSNAVYPTLSKEATGYLVNSISESELRSLNEQNKLAMKSITKIETGQYSFGDFQERFLWIAKNGEVLSIKNEAAKSVVGIENEWKKLFFENLEKTIANEIINETITSTSNYDGDYHVLVDQIDTTLEIAATLGTIASTTEGPFSVDDDGNNFFIRNEEQTRPDVNTNGEVMIYHQEFFLEAETAYCPFLKEFVQMSFESDWYVLKTGMKIENFKTQVISETDFKKLLEDYPPATRDLGHWKRINDAYYLISKITTGIILKSPGQWSENL